ncbi:helix-turn-helix domain-containing protein [Schumannella sp. 10F1B-5-1]|uniref:helix-turn-helix domain-containing protein n=1 Tax=Schumannella sp. 10F1B-5-1 TaxID=2590780 RepID=UPI0011317079|nr:transcriptional regulator [Schumannella sp. 10F1B-5-1]TPW73466.1 helix-turn-helix domain-containing protein [Schumannella sp. 10F1B-5-1]
MNETRISTLRRERGWTQERLAEQSGVAVRTIQRLERGSDASLETLTMLARAFDVPVRDLFDSVDGAAFGESVDGLDSRTEQQQEQRDRATRSWRSLYVGLGVVVSLAVIAVIGFTGWGQLIFVTAAYWAGGALLGRFLMDAVIEPRLDERYPLSRSTRRGRDRDRDR